jgi:hypothetical protein
MTASIQRPGESRREAMARARQSRRPSRLGGAAGAAPDPDYPVGADAGFAGLLRRTWQRALAAPDLTAAVDTLLTLDGHVPAEVQLRGLRTEHEVALAVLFGRTWRHDAARFAAEPDPTAATTPAFFGELGLTTGGQVVLRVPPRGPLADEEDLIDGVIRVPWPAAAVPAYRAALRDAVARRDAAAADCRQWLADAGEAGRDELLEVVTEAALRTAPFVLYQEDKRYTNFRGRNTLTGKTLWPGHPDCAPSGLRGLPLDLWSDNDVSMVVCLTLLIRSAGFGRIEEANSTQLTLDHVADLLERARQNYNAAPVGQPVPPPATRGVADLVALAEALRERRVLIGKDVQLYREIHGALLHKIERVSGPRGDGARQREQAVCARLRDRLWLDGGTLADLGAALAASPERLTRPHGAFATGLEAVVYETVSAATEAFEADFTMSRGIRSLPRLVAAMRDQDWAEIARWEIAEFFCCVVPSPSAARYFDDSAAHLADKAWAMSSRMQYNSWHFIAGNLPKVPEVVDRDHFVPPTLPDVAFFSDQHHHGHVAAKVRFSIRSPHAVRVLDRTFNGFVDMRLLRCAGTPFGEQDLLAAHRTSAFVAKATGLAADLAADGAGVEVTAFDSRWHWTAITGTADPAEPALRIAS